MTGPGYGIAPGPRIRCPICLEMIVLSQDLPLYELQGTNDYRELEISSSLNDMKRRLLLSSSFICCPNPSGDTQQHFLPARYAEYGEPLVIGIIGSVKSGKSHYLASVVAAMESDALLKHGISAAPVDYQLHKAYLDNYVWPFVRDQKMLLGTVDGITDYADAFLLTTQSGTRPVAFFDVSGEDLANPGKSARFIANAGGLIFVVDPGRAIGVGGYAGMTDDTFTATLDKLGPPYIDIPAVIVVNKSDRLRFEPPVDSWLRSPPAERLDPTRIAAESRDVYAFLHQRGARAWLKPYHACRRCTLHFVSSTGSEAISEHFARKAKGQRVLEPLISLFAMAGLIADPASVKVGVL